MAILPAGMRNKDILAGWELEWSPIYASEFEGTTVSVVMLKADRISDNRKASAI